MNPFSAAGLVAAGVALGLFFFGGLWLTVLKLPSARHPALLALGSFWIRSAVVAGSAVMAVRGRWQNGLILAFGFTLGRLVTSRLMAGRRLPKCT